MDTKEILKNQLAILPKGINSFIEDEAWKNAVLEISKKFKFDEEKSTSLENEVFLVLICLEPEEDFEENIKKELALDQNMAEWVVEDIQRHVFSKINKEINAFVYERETEQSGVGNSYEQIIRNQTIAMMPARLASDGVAGGPALHASQEEAGKPALENEVPDNLPTEEDRVIHNYVGDDPYREDPL